MAVKKMATDFMAMMAILSMHSAMAQPTTASGGAALPVSPSGLASSNAPASADQSSSASQPASSSPNSSTTMIPAGTSSDFPGQTTGDPFFQPTTTPRGMGTTTTTLNGGHVIPTHIADMPVGYPLGCWLQGSTPGRALTDAFFEDDHMTPHACSQLCSNYTLFGLEYGSQCECGNYIIPGRAFPVDKERCQIPCSGNSSISCGGSGTLYIYQQLPPPPPLPYGLFSNISYTSDGCLAEPTEGSRALNAFVLADPGMTPAFCAEVCGLSNYLYFGVEYGNECWCDNLIPPTAVFTDPSECNFPCAGDSSQMCGGTLALNLWKGTYVNKTARAKSETAPTASLDERMHGENMPLGNRFYNQGLRLLAPVRRVTKPARESDK